MGYTSSTFPTSTNTPKKSSSIFLQIIENEDRTITRPAIPLIPPSDDKTSTILTKDITLNPDHYTKLRIYLPNNIKTDTKKLPIIIYYHGGGFVLFSPDFILYHQFCYSMSNSLQAIIVSLDYRLAPENCLPAAYDDAVEAINWVKTTSDSWIVDYGDLANCFIMGSSSGGNMAYFAGLRASKLDLGMMRINGVVMIQPYFGGEVRTKSEIDSEEDDVLPLKANEMMWRMALPIGEDRDHEYCNPLKGGGENKEIGLPKCMVIGCKGDPLFDRQKMFVEMLEKVDGVRLVVKMEEEEMGYHAVELFDAAKAEEMFTQIQEFVSEC